MSYYETYDETSRHYDHTRVAVGAEIILGCLARQDKTLESLTVLDAGCGTGAYSQAIVGSVGRIEALDMSQGMLDAARAKLAEPADAGRVAFHQGPITALPFEDASLDGVMINQVLHHLADEVGTGAGADYPLHRQVLAEFARVLRPGAGLVVNSCSREQLDGAYWYYQLAPAAKAAMIAGFVPLDDIEAILGDVGFALSGRFVPVDGICQGAAYFDGRGPLQKAWRDGDSFWALADEAELARALDLVEDLDRQGRLDGFVAKHDARRAHIGQITFLHAVRI
ncbi:MAG: class I SAM-dependent methyltransferase [Alphaproteobacteria bacterium]|jgi:ubiquinone/menaquinone biosynthesis C-methylase UbiE